MLAATFDSLCQAPSNTLFFSLVLWTKDWGINLLFTERACWIYQLLSTVLLTTLNMI